MTREKENRALLRPGSPNLNYLRTVALFGGLVGEVSTGRVGRTIGGSHLSPDRGKTMVNLSLCVQWKDTNTTGPWVGYPKVSTIAVNERDALLFGPPGVIDLIGALGSKQDDS